MDCLVPVDRHWQAPAWEGSHCRWELPIQDNLISLFGVDLLKKYLVIKKAWPILTTSVDTLKLPQTVWVVAKMYWLHPNNHWPMFFYLVHFTVESRVNLRRNSLQAYWGMWTPTWFRLWLCFSLPSGKCIMPLFWASAWRTKNAKTLFQY